MIIIRLYSRRWGGIRQRALQVLTREYFIAEKCELEPEDVFR